MTNRGRNGLNAVLSLNAKGNCARVAERMTRCGVAEARNKRRIGTESFTLKTSHDRGKIDELEEGRKGTLAKTFLFGLFTEELLGFCALEKLWLTRVKVCFGNFSVATAYIMPILLEAIQGKKRRQKAEGASKFILSLFH